MGNNMLYWEQVSKPPKDALKTITGGRLKGMTDINPQWRFEIMTNVFGLCGIGWKYEIVKLWDYLVTESKEILCFAQINLYIKDNDKWSDAIPGTGGSKLLSQESKGAYASDEGYKMAITDALSVAMKQIGVGSEIYRGRWDGSKYEEPKDEKKPEKKEPSKEQAKTEPKGEPLTEGLVKELYDIVKEAGGGYADIVAVAKAKNPAYITKNSAGEEVVGFLKLVDRSGYLAIRTAFEKGCWPEIVELGKFPEGEPGLFY